MQPNPRHRAVESRFRQLVIDAELPPPDNVEYLFESIMFRWEGPKVAVVVDLDDLPGICSTDCATLVETWPPESSERG